MNAYAPTTLPARDSASFRKFLSGRSAEFLDDGDPRLLAAGTFFRRCMECADRGLATNCRGCPKYAEFHAALARAA